MIPTATPYPVLPSPDVPLPDFSVGLIGLVILLTLLGVAVAWLRYGSSGASRGDSGDE